MKVTSILRRSGASLLCIAPFISGCIAWRTGNLEYPIELQFAPEDAQRPYRLTYQLVLNSKEYDSTGFTFGASGHTLQHSEPGSSLDVWGQLEAVVEQSGWFASVKRTPEPAELHLDLRLSHVIHVFETYTLSELTFGAIPTWLSTTWTLEAEVRLADGKRASYAFEDSDFGIFWMPFLPLAPFLNPLRLEYRMRENLFRHLVKDLRRDGFLTEIHRSSEQGIAGGLGEADIEIRLVASKESRPGRAPSPEAPEAVEIVTEVADEPLPEPAREVLVQVLFEAREPRAEVIEASVTESHYVVRVNQSSIKNVRRFEEVLSREPRVDRWRGPPDEDAYRIEIARPAP